MIAVFCWRKTEVKGRPRRVLPVSCVAICSALSVADGTRDHGGYFCHASGFRTKTSVEIARSRSTRQGSARGISRRRNRGRHRPSEQSDQEIDHELRRWIRRRPANSEQRALQAARGGRCRRLQGAWPPRRRGVLERRRPRGQADVLSDGGEAPGGRDGGVLLGDLAFAPGAGRGDEEGYGGPAVAAGREPDALRRQAADLWWVRGARERMNDSLPRPLRRVVRRLRHWWRPPSADGRYLAAATDPADLERRSRILERERGGPAIVAFSP